jgi:cell division cycle 2-like
MGSQCYGPAMEVWAVGCIMAELLSGKLLFMHMDMEDQG